MIKCCLLIKEEGRIIVTIDFRIRTKGEQKASKRKESLMVSKAQLKKLYENLLQQEVDLLEAELKHPDLPRAFRAEAKRELKVAKGKLTRLRNNSIKVANPQT
jgi:hypothetical protein